MIKYFVLYVFFLDYIRDIASKALINVYKYESVDRKEPILKLLIKQLSEYMAIGNNGKDSSGLEELKKFYSDLMLVIY